MSGTTKENYYEALWPRSPRQVKKKQLAKRLDTLNGKTIAHVWDYMFRGDEIFTLLEEGIRKQYPDAKFVNWAEFGSTHGSDERAIVAGLPEKYKALKVDAVISGMGC